MSRMFSLLTFAMISSAAVASAQALGTVMFEDSFERPESQETKDEPGNGWGTNSKSRAKGNKQVDLRDGAMFISIHAEADHAVSVTQPAVFTDGAVSMRFMLENSTDSLGLDFADSDCKDVHAGHLFAARISAQKVILQDLKTGVMRLDIHDARKAKESLTEEQQAAMKGKDKPFPYRLEIGRWHDLVVTVAGDMLAVSIDGKPVGEFKSPGIGHSTKRMLRLSVPKQAVVDDVKIYRKS